MIDEVKRQSADGHTERPPPRSAKKAKHAVDESVTCRHCPHPVALGQLRCWVHKRAFDSILINTKKDGEASEMEEFEKTFGKTKDDEGDIEKANLVMANFLEKFPDGKGKPGKPRGKGFKVSSVTHATGYRKEKSAVATDRLWDFELFCGKLKSLRGWDTARSKSEWDLIKADPSCYADMGGPRWSRERVQVPASLIGEVGTETKETAFEERRLDTSTKAKASIGKYSQASHT